MARVFVSYAREDSAKAKAVARALERASFDIWFDGRIHSGSEYSREIEQALAGAAAVVVLWSRASVESGWVRDEAAEGRDSGRLVAVLLDDSRPPIGFRQFQATDLSRWSGRGSARQIDQIIAAVRAKSRVPSEGPVKPAKASPVSRRRSLVWGAAAAAVLLAGVGGALFVSRDRPAPDSAPSVALLPFTADASDADARKLSLAAHDAVAHTLSQGAFTVSAIDAVPPGGGAPADFLISGQSSSTPDKVVTSVRMEETAHHVVVFSHQFESSRTEAPNLPEQIGAQVAAQLSWTAPLLAIERRYPSDPAITAALLQGSAGLEGGSELHNFETAQRIAARAPNSPLAQNTLAFNTAFALELLPREQRAAAVAAARRAADRTIELAPDFGGAYIPWCLLHGEVRMAECEDRLRTGVRVDPDGPFEKSFLAGVLNGTGRSREALDLASLSLAHDPYMPIKIGMMLRLLEANGRNEEADRLFNQSARWWPGNQAIAWYRRAGMVQRGDFQAARRFERQAGDRNHLNPALAIAGGSVAAARAACLPDKVEALDGIICMLGLARLGDLDGAFALAGRLYPSRLGRNAADEDRLWLDNPGTNPVAFLIGPAAAPMRRDGRYLALAARVGLLAYWRSGRLPDFCTVGHEPICASLAGRQ